MTRERPAAQLLAARRLTAQGLSGEPATTPEDVVGRLLAVQAQDPRGWRLAIRARSTGLAAADVETALTKRRSMVVSWLNRGTLHLVPAEDYWWLHPLTTPQLASSSVRRLAQEGVSPEQAARGAELIAQAVSERPRSRDSLRGLLDENGVPTQRQAFVHVLLATCLSHDLVRGPVVDGEQAFVSAAQWLGAAPAALDRDEALARLALRYLAGHGPALVDDLAYWTGCTLGDARRGFAAIAAQTSSDADGLTWLTDSPKPAPVPGPRLLGPYDPLLHGWRSRLPVVGDHQGVVTSNGLFRPTALVRGKVVATWGLADGTLTISTLQPVPASVQRALVRDAAAVLSYLGLPAKPAVVRSKDP
ncbi:winged helix DNA-binding domain-containing protein [Angustibacter sp. McL0619]|uniref:winged helix DNA-binding domain-containing protein n=1 Tax=Angustibacter sp. McL0619 TaxID=3415676 RepID=UPI003CF28870